MEIFSRSAKHTIKIGRQIAKSLKPPDIICLFGQLGSGKTVLTKGIAAGIGIRPSEITSPSFVLIRQYRGNKFSLYHFDLYRLKIEQEILSLGYEEYLYDEAVTVIEWADRLKYLLPKEYLKIELFIKTNSQRSLKFTAFGSRYKKLLERIYENIRH